MSHLRSAAALAALLAVPALASAAPTFAQANAEAAARRGPERSLSTQLIRAREAVRLGHQPSAALMTDAAGRLRIAVRCDVADAALVDALGNAGAEVTFAEPGSGYTEAWAPASALEAIASVPGVNFVRPILPAVGRGGSVITEGDVFHGSQLTRQAYHVSGYGIKVGLITTGARGLAAAQATSDIPLVVDNQTPLAVSTTSDGEGTAMLEILQDVSPDARLAYAAAITPGNYIQALNNLVAADCDLIVDHLGFYSEPFFEDGMLAQAVAAAVNGGTHFIVAAGNDAMAHWEDDYVDVNPVASTAVSDDFHAFHPGDAYLSITIRPQTLATVVLQWNDPFGASANDYNLYLYEAALSTLYDSSVDIQDGNDDPFEFVTFNNSTNSDALAQIAIDRPDPTDADRRFELFVIATPLVGEDSIGRVLVNEAPIPDGSIFGQAALVGVVTVGALDVTAPSKAVVEPYGSRGPCRIDFASAEVRLKPNLAAADRVSISPGGGEPIPFIGTSASAAHAAGIAALMLEVQPDLTPAQLRLRLETSCFDLPPFNYDIYSGAGRLDAFYAFAIFPLTAADNWSIYR